MSMNHMAEMRRCLRECDTTQMRKLWAHIAPGMPQPMNDDELLVSLHMARTLANFLSINGRAYSHRWLIDRGLPSQLPDGLKPKAERIYPKVFNAVGIASMAGPGHKTKFNYAVERVMSDAVLEAYADGHEHEPLVVKNRMMEKREEFKKQA